MGILAHKPAFSLFTLLLTVIGACSGGSDAPRGVAVGFVFDVSARCEPPCGHGGVCIRNDTCFCSRGYEGERCQYANCFPKCKNGGTCLRPGKCRCQPGYGGRYCHKVTCADGCWNGGECTAVNGVAKCICPSSWTGSKCQDAICPQGCRNGGFCVAPGICRCPEGWLGGACHTGEVNTHTQLSPSAFNSHHFYFTCSFSAPFMSRLDISLPFCIQLLGFWCQTLQTCFTEKANTFAFVSFVWASAVCSQTCLNGGKCISPNKCRCRPHFSGPRCEERKKSH
uniref:Schwann cell-specific EGF-like repeat autocrine factor n=1 Tax=Fundulus heteroclitus TaxID=8078 RepID=A0A3Q2QJ74_FUNHE